jgi:GNAT superfamily N-acetyltransferase
VKSPRKDPPKVGTGKHIIVDDEIMAEEIRIAEVTQDNLYTSVCCGIKDVEHEGHVLKTNWLEDYLDKGLKAKILFTEDDRQFGYIEYLPGEYAWRAVEAEGYMFIHCLWTFYKKYQRKGYGMRLIQSCIDDAKKAKMKGAAVVARKRPWLANSTIFLKHGFEIVDTAPPDYELLVFKFKTSAVNSRFKGGWDEKVKKYGKGMTIIQAQQCPHTIRFSEKIVAMAKNDYGLDPKIVELKTHHDAQEAPTPYAAFAIIYEGKLIADHQVSASRFENIMNKILVPKT